MTKKAAIIGGGAIAHGWAARFLLNGWDVALCDDDPKAEQKASQVLANARRSLPALSDNHILAEGKLSFAASIAEAVVEADWILESVPERLDTKQKALAEIQTACRADALIATSTATFSLAELQQDAKRPDQIFLARAVHPVYLLPLVELQGNQQTCQRAAALLSELGMAPVTEMPENTDARASVWAQLGLFEAAHFAVNLEDPENPDAQELEQKRDDSLVAVLRALKARDFGIGTILKADDEAKKPPLPQDITQPLKTLQRIIPIDWTDYNGHMNESRYGQVFSDAGDVVMAMIGADADYIASGLSYFTVDNHITYAMETHPGEAIHVRTQVLEARGKKLRLYHEMMRKSDDTLLATCNQLLLHVSLETRRTCEPQGDVLTKITALGEAQSRLPKPVSLRE